MLDTQAVMQTDMIGLQSEVGHGRLRSDEMGSCRGKGRPSAGIEESEVSPRPGPLPWPVLSDGAREPHALEGHNLKNCVI